MGKNKGGSNTAEMKGGGMPGEIHEVTNAQNYQPKQGMDKKGGKNKGGK